MNNYLVIDVRDSDLVGLRIRNTENVKDKVVGISFRHRLELKPDLVRGVLGKVVKCNVTFGFCDRFEVHLDNVRIPVGKGREKTKGRTLDVLSAIKKIIVKVKTGFFCLAHALIIVMAKTNGVPKYISFRDSYSLKQPVQDLLSASGVDLANGGGLMNLNNFKIIFRTTKL